MLKRLIDTINRINFTEENVKEFEELAIEYSKSDEPQEEISIAVNVFQTYSMLFNTNPSDVIKYMYLETVHDIANKLSYKYNGEKRNSVETFSTLVEIDHKIDKFVSETVELLVDFSEGKLENEDNRMAPAMRMNGIVAITNELYVLMHTLDSDAKMFAVAIESKLTTLEKLSGLLSDTIREVGIQGVTREVADELLVKYWYLQ